MPNFGFQPGSQELAKVRRESRSLFWFTAIFSGFVNILMLTGPLYMLQVYDRVLGSRSEATLVALSVLVIFLYGMMGLLDFARGRIMTRAGARFQAALDHRVFDAMIRRSVVAKDPVAQTGLSDLESVQKLISSPAVTASFDLPWTPVFLAGIALFHPWLGMLALGGGSFLIAITLLNQVFTKGPQQRSNTSTQKAILLSEEIRNEAEMIQAMGMRDAAFARWKNARDAALVDSVASADIGGGFTTLTKTLRMILQSAMLGLGAYLVLFNELTPGAMIAGSILMGRALSPIELVLSNWPLVQRATKGWRSLAELLTKVPYENNRTELPKPKAHLKVKGLTVVAPGTKVPLLRNVNFEVIPGQAIGVIGPSGSGKSTLSRALTGVWSPVSGSIRLNGATLDQFHSNVLGNYIGYLPQRIEVFEGSVAQNIARLNQTPDPELVVAAAQKAAAHAMILKLPHGYDTTVDTAGGQLSGGQMQRIGLARALFGDPVITILDEPNSNLDNEGSNALNAAIKQIKSEGRAVLIMAHRPAAIQECDMLLMIDKGQQVAFGPRDEVLKAMVENHKQLRSAKSIGGVQ